MEHHCNKARTGLQLLPALEEYVTPLPYVMHFSPLLLPFLLSSNTLSIPFCNKVVFYKTNMALPLEAADRSLIDILLEEGFGTQVIAQRVKCTARTVQWMSRKKKQPNISRRKARTSRCSCLTPAMRKAIYDILIEDTELYIKELVEFILKSFSKKVLKSYVACAVKDWP